MSHFLGFNPNKFDLGDSTITYSLLLKILSNSWFLVIRGFTIVIYAKENLHKVIKV